MADRVTIRCRLDGPLVIEIGRDPAHASHDVHPAGAAPVAAVQVVDHEGRPFPLPTHKRVVALCRCGRSRTRPFCDGSHKEAGFVARETAGSPPT